MLMLLIYPASMLSRDCGTCTSTRCRPRGSEDFHTFVENGVLGICDMGSPLSELDNIIRWRSETADGRLLGPRIVAAGPIVDGADPMFPNISVAAANASDGRQIVGSLKARGADFIKVY